MVSLRKINENNWRDCIALKVSNEQARFVATNENGLALAFAHKEMEPRGIYKDELMVGFIMYAKDPDDGLYYINRFMVDEKYQRKGYGKEALNILLNDLKEKKVDTLDILHKPDNDIAIKLYMSLGFELTDVTVGSDVVSTIKLFYL